MPQVTGVLETALYVSDLDVAERFYQDVLGFQPMTGDHRLRALSVCDRQVLLLFLKGASTTASVLPGGVLPAHDGTGQQHLAFAIAESELEPWRQRLAERGVALESTMRWDRGGTSLYFRDPDGHLLEFVTPGCWPIY